MKAALRDAMNKRFGHIKSQPNLIAATLLDPRFKDMYFSIQEKEDAKRTVIAFLDHQRSEDRGQTSTTDNLHEDSSQTSASTTPSTSSSLWDDYDSYVAIEQATSADNSGDNSLNMELDGYLRQPRVGRSTNIYGYWHCSQFPNLEPAAKKFLSAPPTSVASEQLFSAAAAGQIYSDRRCSLLGEDAEKLLFLAYNIRLFNYDY